MRRLLTALTVMVIAAGLCGTAGAQAGSEQMQLESSVVLEGENVAGFVSNALPGQRIDLAWADAFGDVLYRTTITGAGATPATFAFRAVGAPFPVTRIDAGWPGFQSSVPLTIMPREDALQYSFFVAVDAAGEASPARAMALRQAGVTAATVEGYQGAFAAGNTGLRPLVGGLVSTGVLSLDEESFQKLKGSYDGTGDAAALVRSPSLSDEEEFTRLLTEVSRQAERVRTIAPAALVIADGPSTTWKTEPLDLSFGGEDLAAFSRYLSARAPRLVPPARLGGERQRTIPLSAREMKALVLASPEAPVSFAPWALHREFMDVTLARTLSDISRAAVSAAKQPGPSSVNWSIYRPLTAVSGAYAPAAYGGYDWTLFARDIDLAVMSSEAPQWSWALARDISTSGRAAAAIDAKSPAVGALVWRAMCEGLAGVALENSDGVAPAQPAAAPAREGRREEAAPRRRDELQAALSASRIGFADLVANLRKDATAVLVYSPKSVRAGWMLECMASETSADAPADAGTRAYAAWSHIFDDLGIDYRWVAIEDVASGALERLLPRVVVLPETWCVTEEASQALLQYANAGGLVIADIGAGLLDGDYAAYRQPPLDALFGSRRPALTGGRARTMTPVAPAGEAPAPAAGSQPPAPGIARIVAAQRARAVNVVGQGGGLLLNRSVADYKGASDKAGGELLASLESVLGAAGIAPKAIVYLDGKPISAAVTAFASERTQVLFIRPADGALPEDKVSKIDVRLRGTASVYNLLSAASEGEFLGTTDRVTLDATAKVPIVLSITSAPLTGILFEPTVGSGTFFVNVQLQAEAPLGDRLIKVEFYAPGGIHAAQFDRVALARGGAWLGTVLMPINAPSGVWRIVCRDVETGMTAWRDIEAR